MNRTYDEGEIRGLEELALHAWPAAEVADLDGWRLRFNHGVTRRTNSVWPNRRTGELGIDERLERVEAFYRERDLPPRFQLTRACLPGDLDAVLEERGWLFEEATLVQIAPVREVARLAGADAGVEIDGRIDDDWARSAWPEASRADGDVRRATAERIEATTAFALARLDGEPAGVGLAVASGSWAGLFCFHTLAQQRRRGAARSILRALASWASERGGEHLYLQVEEGNRGARELYASVGFRTAYAYHYRMLAS